MRYAGQTHIFDLGIEEDRRPCRYKFHRYVGQRIRTSHGRGVITKIVSPYYTYFKNDRGEELVGTPHDMVPENPEERIR